MFQQYIIHIIQGENPYLFAQTNKSMVKGYGTSNAMMCLSTLTLNKPFFSAQNHLY